MIAKTTALDACEKGEVVPVATSANTHLIREEPFFFGDGQRLFGVLHRPNELEGLGRFGWIICAPFGQERGTSHRTLVEWARALCREGQWVLRLDYRGYGDSAGSFTEFTLSDHLRDISAARALLEEQSGSDSVGLYGLRLGASLAAMAAADQGGNTPLVLWEPVVRGPQYVDELLRAALADDLANARRAPRTRDGMKKAIASGGKLVIEGHPIGNDLWQSLESVDLLAKGRPGTGPILIVRIAWGSAKRPRPDLLALHRLYSEGAGAELQEVSAPTLWGGSELKAYAARVMPSELFDVSLDWVRRHISGQTRRTAAESQPSRLVRQEPERSQVSGEDRCDSVLPVALSDPPLLSRAQRELPVQFTVGGSRVVGILHLPSEQNPDQPAVLLLPQGFNCRTARHRLYVDMARDLAQAGFATLRFDPRGLGDSEGRQEFATGAELGRAIQLGLFVPDTVAAIRFLQEQLGTGKVVLAGVCAGASTAVLAADQDRRVLAIACVELPLRVPAPPDAPDAQPLALYKGRVASLHSWLRLLSFRSDYRLLFRSVAGSLAKRMRSVCLRDGDRWFLERLGPNANLGLIACFRRHVARRLPILCVFGETESAWLFKDTKDRLLPESEKGANLITVQTMDGADHDFSEPTHAQQLIRITLDWLRTLRPSSARGNHVRKRASSPGSFETPVDVSERSVPEEVPPGLE